MSVKNRGGRRAVDLDLGEQRERHVVYCEQKVRISGLAARLLMTELVAREAEHREAARAIPPIQGLKGGVLRGEAAAAGDVDHQQHVAREIVKRARVAIDCLKANVGGK